MKRSERHKLRENPFATWINEMSERALDYSRELMWAGVAIVAIVAVVLGYNYWRAQAAAKADTELAAALAIADAAVVPPPAPGAATDASKAPQPGTYPTEKAKLEAALPKFLDIAQRYPSTHAATTALYHAGATLAELGRFDEAASRYQQVIAEGGGTVYAEMAQLGLATIDVSTGKAADAVSIYEKLVAAPDTQLPLDGVLVQLARAYQRLGKTDDATRTYRRIIDEFPQSLYITETRQALGEMGAGQAS
jgi:TolA-binding protein